MVNGHDPLKSPLKRNQCPMSTIGLWGLPTLHLREMSREIFWRHLEDELQAIHSTHFDGDLLYVGLGAKDTAVEETGVWGSYASFHQRESDRTFSSEQGNPRDDCKYKENSSVFPKKGPRLL